MTPEELIEIVMDTERERQARESGFQQWLEEQREAAKHPLEDEAAAHGIYFGASAPIEMENTNMNTHRLGSNPYAPPAEQKPKTSAAATPPRPAPTPQEAQSKLDRIAKILGFKPPVQDLSVFATEIAVLVDAVTPKPPPTAEEIAATSRCWGISEREVRMCHEVGCDVAAYVALKRKTQTRR